MSFRAVFRLIAILRDNLVAAATIISCVIAAVVLYLEWPTFRAETASPEIPQSAESVEEDVSSALSETPSEGKSAAEIDPEIASEEISLSPDPPLPDPPLQEIKVILGYSVEALRETNGVREMFPLEQGQELSSLSGVHGFIHYFSLGLMFNQKMDIDVPVSRVRTLKDSVEVHKTTEGNTMLLVYVDESTAARLGNTQSNVGRIFGFYQPFDTHTILVGLPAIRISAWQHRLGGEGEFAEIQID